MGKPKIFVVGADKGGVGKTTIARVLLDYLSKREVKTRIVDTEYPAGDLKRFYPAADVVDLRVVKDQMRVFDGVCVDSATVLDIRAGVLSPTLSMLDEAHFLDDVRSGELILVVLHVLGPSIASLSEVGQATALIGGGLVRHLVVKNHINDTDYDLADDSRYVDIFRALEPATINVPKLAEIAGERVQQAGLTFEEFASTNDSRMLRGKVRHWLNSVYAQFDRVGIPNILAA